MKIDKYIPYLLLSTTLIATNVSAQEQADGKFYVQTSIGHNLANNLSGPRTTVFNLAPTTPASAHAEMDFDQGYLLSIALGYHSSDNLRLELETAKRSNDLNSYTVGSATNPTSTNGNVSVESLMVNMIYTFDNSGFSLRPYIGAGLGVGNVDVEYSSTLGYTGVRSDNSISWAAQACAGLNWAVSSEWELFAQYQIFTVANPDLEISYSSNTFTQTDNLDENYVSNTFSLGVRYNF